MLIALPDNFVYFSLSLINADREKLIKVANEIIPKQMTNATKIYVDHITLLHKNDKRSTITKLRMYELLNYIFEKFIGEIYEVNIVAFGSNNKTAAFKVELPDGFPIFLYKQYHITIATFNGAKPVESNNIINWRELNEPITVTTILTKTTHENF